MLSLSSCWNSHRHEAGEHIAHEARRLGLEYIELSHGLKVSHLPGLLKAVEHNVIKVSSVHNFCPSPVEVMMDAPDAYEFTSHRESDRERALDLTERTMETAARIGGISVTDDSRRVVYYCDDRGGPHARQRPTRRRPDATPSAWTSPASPPWA